jgi:hypothetical protein
VELGVGNQGDNAMERWPMATATTQGKHTASLHETCKQHEAQHLRQGGRVSMSRRTKWIIAAAAALLGASPASAQSAVLGTTNTSSPTWEVPIPLMWDQNKDEGFYFSAEAAIMRINNSLQNQVVAKRGFIDYDGSIKGDPNGGVINIFDTANPPNYITTLFTDRGPAGAIYGSQAVALSTGQINNDVFQPGSRFTIGYRLRNGITIEGSYMGITKSRVGATAGVTPPNHSTGQDNSDSYLYGDFYNFSTLYSGPSREILSNVFLMTIPPGAGNNLGIAPVPADLRNLGGFAVSAYGITNGAEIFRIAETMGIHTSELNLKVPVAQFEGTRTYWTGGLRYISFTEQFRMITQDFGFPDSLNTSIPFTGGVISSEDRPEWALQYTNKQKDIFYGLQTGVGGEAYLFNGLAFSIDGKIGIMAENSKSSTVLQRMDYPTSGIGQQRTDNLFTVAGMFEGGAYLWWYAHEGITFRVGYEFLGILNARRMVDPIDYNLGQLNPTAHNSFLSLDGFVMGFSFIF